MKKTFDLNDLIGEETKTLPAVLEIASEPLECKLVPNKWPTLNHTPYRIAIVGEAPGSDESIQGIPFVGMSGRFLNALLSKAGIAREACFLGNIMQYQPPRAFRNGKLTQLSPYDSWKNTSQGNLEEERMPLLHEGLNQLRVDLEVFKPNLVLLLGAAPLQAFTLKKEIGNWRGSLMEGTLPGDTIRYKCLPSWHPAACLRNYEYTAVLLFDLHRAKQEGQFPELALPQRELEVGLAAEEIISRLDSIYTRKCLIAIDIEGTVQLMSCIGVAESATQAFIVPFCDLTPSPLWDVETELLIWRALVRVLESPDIPKILQNSLYDRFVLQYAYGICVRGVAGDIMLKTWERFCELEKSLAFQASIYTMEPAWKHEGKKGKSI